MNKGEKHLTHIVSEFFSATMRNLFCRLVCSFSNICISSCIPSMVLIFSCSVPVMEIRSLLPFLISLSSDHGSALVPIDHREKDYNVSNDVKLYTRGFPELVESKTQLFQTCCFFDRLNMSFF